MKRKLLILGVFIISGLISLVGLQNPAMASKAKEVRLGVITALSGPAAPWGIPNYRSILLDAEAINQAGGFKVNGQTYKWKLMVYDHKYIPAEAVKDANRAIYEDKCQFLAIQGGAPTLACIPLMKQNNILSLDFAGGGKAVTNPNNPLVFRYNPSIDLMYASTFPLLKKREKIKTVASIDPDDATGQSGMVAAEKAAARDGLKIISKQFFERGTKDLTALLTRVIAKKPDLIETGYTDPTTAALICKQARELGYKGAILLAWGPSPAQVKKIAGPYADKAYMTVPGPLLPKTKLQKKIYKAFVAKWGKRDWDPMVWVEYGLVSCLTKGIETAQSFNPQKIAQALDKVSWMTPVGKDQFGGTKFFGIKRQSLYPNTVYQFQHGKPVDLGTFKAVKGIMD